MEIVILFGCKCLWFWRHPFFFSFPQSSKWLGHAVVTVKDSGFYAFLTVLDKLLGFVAHEPGRIVLPENASVSVTPCLRKAGRLSGTVCLSCSSSSSPLWLSSGNRAFSARELVWGAQFLWMPAIILLQLSLSLSWRSVHSLAAVSHLSSLNLFGMFNTGRFCDTLCFLQHPRSLDKRFSEKKKSITVGWICCGLTAWKSVDLHLEGLWSNVCGKCVTDGKIWLRLQAWGWTAGSKLSIPIGIIRKVISCAQTNFGFISCLLLVCSKYQRSHFVWLLC